MPPVSIPWGQELWGEAEYESLSLDFDFLLPTGIVIQLEVARHASLQDIKQKLWDAAKEYPLYSNLKDKGIYVFMCVNELGDRVELQDETQRISTVRPFTTMLKVVEKKGNRAEKILNAQISNLLGKGLHEFDNLKNSEVSDFRQHMRQYVERVVKERDDQPWLQKVMCFYPPDIATDPELPPHLTERLQEGCVQCRVHIKLINTTYTFQTPADQTPESLVQMALDKMAKNSGQPLQRQHNFVLKVAGREEYLLGEFPLKQFVYMRKCIGKGNNPTLILVHRDSIVAGEAPIIPSRGGSRTPQNLTAPPSPHQPKRGKCLWDLDGQYCLNINRVTNVNFANYSKVQLRASVYHGGDVLCDVINGKEVMLSNGVATWEEDMAFKINLADLPRMSRLCFLLYAISDRRNKKDKKDTQPNAKKSRRQEVPLAWVNITLFDYQDMLRSGHQMLYMWSITDDDILTEELLNPIGTVECNPHATEAVCLHFSFRNVTRDGLIFYPPFERVLDVAAQHTNIQPGGMTPNVEDIRKTMSGLMYDENVVGKDKLGQLQAMVERDPLDMLHEHEKEMIWNLRYECNFHFRESLPKLLSCVSWNNHLDVAQMQALLQIWHKLPPTGALELLDHQYADKSVRKFAVECLEQLSNSELFHYLLQLVQALKYESYLECPLVEFLLNRALTDQRIGHTFFWLLRAEMHVPSVSVRFGLILEAYCRGNINHLKGLVKEVEAFNQLKQLSEAAKKMKGSKDDMKGQIQKLLDQEGVYYSALSEIQCPLDTGQRLKNPIPSKCKFMDSKMRPLWLVMQNADTFGDDIYLMFKKGDDLRQDMLTLQILRIMDHIWQKEGLDLRLNAYTCLSTGHREGFIEVVTESETIANIQKAGNAPKITAAFNKHSLYNYLKGHNRTRDSLNTAMDEFSSSCAGYTVATYVLGVADRHSDNIMLKTNGQFFHIDFGHILGHFKSKYGVKRERVPFVLTTDFVYVIRKGPENSQESFIKFQGLCEDAFMALRSQSRLLITLFLMMMNTGIPEVSCRKDIEYLKGTLRPELSDDEARQHFQSKFKEALKNSWKAALNFTARNLKGDNT